MDLVIKAGKVFDPRWESFKELNIGIKHGRIAALTEKDLSGNTVIDANGLIVSPGFIDIHSHSDKNFKVQENNFETSEAGLRMGVTTLVGGNCGVSPLNFKEYKDYIDANGAPNNYLGFMGHNTLRSAAGRTDWYSPANKQEIEKIKEMLKENMEEGAIGLSLGLEYTPGADIEEVLEICEALKDFHSPLISAHYRYDADRGLEAVEEMIDISRLSGIPMQISHLNSGICFGNAEESIKVIHNAREEGINVMADCYPYNAFSTYIGSAVFDPGFLERWEAKYEDLLIAEGEYAGQYCTEELFYKLRKEDPGIYLIAFVMREDETITVMKESFTMIATDGLVRNGQGHPRASGTFPRVLGRYSREQKALTLKEALYKMTVMPAQRLNLRDRGIIEEGAFADITIFDYNTVIDLADFTNSSLAPEGIKYVIVNGKLAVFDGRIVNNRLGRIL